MRETIDPQLIEKALADPRKPGMTVRELVLALRLPPGSRPILRRVVREMVARGQLVAMRGRRFGLRRVLGDVVGRFSRHRAGFGFVDPDDPEQDSLFIPIGSQAGALHGDLVAARIVGTRADGRREGVIQRVLERREASFVGVFQPTLGGGGVIRPMDAGFEFEVRVPRGSTLTAAAGELVRVEFEDRGSGKAPAAGQVVERLGQPDTPGVELEVLIRKYGFSREFSAEAEEEAAGLPDRPPDGPKVSRRDFTAGCVVTIDGETAQDFDDAIEVERTPGNGFILHVHIADVAHFVAADSALDQEALARGTSVYFPGRCLPMLPERLSNDLCSLRPEQPRLTQGVSIEYDSQGARKAVAYHRGIICSRARLTYTEVARIIERRDPEARAARSELVPMLDAAAELAQRLHQRRVARGAIDFDLPEPEIILALTGEIEQIVARSRNLAHRMIEEFMLAANEVVAELLLKKREPGVYRVHERPDPIRVENLARVIDGLGYTVPEPFTAVRPADFANLLDLAQGRPEEPFISRVVLRAMALARYDVACDGHFGLALARYLHFTSPIRRYPDLLVHRAFARLLSGERDSPGERADRLARYTEFARECSRLERQAEAAEREAVAWKTASFMAARLGEEFDGRIIEVAPHGILVALAEPAVEGLLPIARLGAEYFRLDSKKQILVGSETGRTYRLGQELRVRVDRIDALAHFVDFCLAEQPPAAPRGLRRGGQRKEGRAAGGRLGRRGARSRR